MLVTALPCRLQNDSPPESINEVHLNKESDKPKLLNTGVDSSQRINENNNLLKSHPKLPPDLECTIDESNYVNLNDITKCKAISNDYNNMRSAQKSTDAIKNGIEKSSQNTIENKNSKLNNFYLQINSTSTIANGHSTSKPIMSIVNQKNLNNLNNGNIGKNCLTNNINNNNNNNNGGVNTHTNNNGCLAVNTANHLNNNCNGINNSNNTNSINCNGVQNECVTDAKSIMTNGIDYNKNGLPTVSTTHTQYDVIGGHNQVQCANKTGSSNNAPPQTYVIQNGNGLLTNGNTSIKEMPRADSNKGKNWLFLFLLCMSATKMA